MRRFSLSINHHLFARKWHLKTNKCNGDTTEQDSKANYIALTAARKSDALSIEVKIKGIVVLIDPLDVPCRGGVLM